MDLELQTSLSCNASPVSVLNDETIVYISGNCVTFWNIANNTKDFIWINAFALTTCAANSRYQQVAVGTEGKDPQILVYSYPEKELLYTLQGQAHLNYTAIAYSKDMSRLVTVGDYPEYKMEVWEGQRRILSTDLNTEPIKIVVLEDICVLLKHEIRIIQLHAAFQLPESRATTDPLEPSYRHTMASFGLAGAVPLDVVFDKFGHIYLSTNNTEIIVLDMELNVKLRMPMPSNTFTMLMTHRYVIVSTSDNKIKWLNVYYPPEKDDLRAVNQEKDVNLKVHKEMILEDPQDIVQLLYTTDYACLLLVGAQGKFIRLNVPAEADYNEDEDSEGEEEDEDEDEEDQIEDEEISPRKGKIKGVGAIPQTLGSYNVATVINALPLGTSTQCASIAEDFRIWDITNGECLMKWEAPEDVTLTSLEVDHQGQLAVLGSSTGVLRLLDVSARSVARVLGVHKLMKYQLDCIKFNEDCSMLVASSKQSKKIYFVKIGDDYSMKILGCTIARENIVQLEWFRGNLMALLGNYLLAHIEVPDLGIEPKLEPIQVETQYRYIASGAQIAILGDKIHLAGSAKELHLYEIPAQKFEEIDTRKLPPDPVDVPAHDILTSAIAISKDNQFMAVGAADGKVIVFETAEMKPYKQKLCHTVTGNGVKSLAFSPDSSFLYTTANDGSFFVWTLGRKVERARKTSESGNLDAIASVDDQPDLDIPKYKTILKQEIAAAEEGEIHRVKDYAREKIAGIRKELNEMLRFNTNAPELEVLDRDEFTVDKKERADIENAGQMQADDMRDSSKKQNLVNELLTHRIKVKSQDSMETQSRVATALRSGKILYNYGIRKLTGKEEIELNRARTFRYAEHMEEETRPEKVKEVVDANEFDGDSYIINHKKFWGNHELIKLAQKEIEKNPKMPWDWELLYSPFQLYTRMRKKNQIVLLQSLIRSVKIGFNAQFQKLLDTRNEILGVIDEKNESIKEKQEELKMDPKVFEHVCHVLEDPSQVLKVDESRITVEKFLTKAERAELEAKRLKEEERLRLLNADDSGPRALVEMMNGTLEVKKDTFNLLTEQLEREEWMDLPPDQLTEDQRFKLKEFEEKEKKHNEDIERIRKLMENELKKLQKDVKDQRDKFDEKLDEVFKLRLETEQEIFQQELIIVRISLSLLQELKNHDELSVVKKAAVDIQSGVDVLRNDIGEFDCKVTYLNSEISNLVDNNKQLDTNFKKLFEATDNPELINKLKNIFRKGALRKGERTSKTTKVDPECTAQVGELNELDAYYEIEKAKIEREYPPITVENELDFNKDAPSGCTEPQFEKTIIERNKKLDNEKQIENKNNLIAKVEKHIEYMSDTLQNKEFELDQLSKEQQVLEEQIDKERYNIELILLMKQAVVEVPQNAVVTNYSDAILINKEIVQSKNREIVRIGTDRVNILKTMREFRVQLARIKWQEKKLKLECEDLTEKEIDVKMLRSDKRTQNILAGKGLDENKQMEQRIDAQIDAMEKITATRVKLLEEKNGKLKTEIKKLKSQNEKFENDVREKQKQRDEREHLKILKESVTDAAKHDPRKKFFQISSRRKLLDLAKQQTEEIEFLRDELDRLRAKTFPSFAHIHSRVDFPDEV